MSNSNKQDGGSGSLRTLSPGDKECTDSFFRSYSSIYILPYWKKYCVTILVFALSFTILSFCYTRKYSAKVTTIITSDLSTLGIGSRLGSISPLVGNKMHNDSPDLMFAINYIDSRELADSFIDKYDLRKELFSDDYDDNGQYKYASKTEKLYQRLFKKSVSDISDIDVYAVPGPSKEKAYKQFVRIFKVEVNEDKGIVTISVTWKDPVKARDWANDYINHANGILKKKAVDESNNKIKYLESQIKNDTPGEIREATYSLVENEMKKITIAEASDEYPFKIVQRAYLPEQKSFPKRFAFLFIGTIFGFVIQNLYISVSLISMKKSSGRHS